MSVGDREAGKSPERAAMELLDARFGFGVEAARDAIRTDARAAAIYACAIGAVIDGREAGRLAGLREVAAYVQTVAAQIVSTGQHSNGQRRMANRILNGIALLAREDVAGVSVDNDGRVGG